MKKSDLKSLDFAVDRLFVTLMKTVNIEIVTVLSYPVYAR